MFLLATFAVSSAHPKTIYSRSETQFFIISYSRRNRKRSLLEKCHRKNVPPVQAKQRAHPNVQRVLLKVVSLSPSSSSFLDRSVSFSSPFETRQETSRGRGRGRGRRRRRRNTRESRGLCSCHSDGWSLDFHRLSGRSGCLVEIRYH